MEDQSPFASPRHVSAITDCYFYHVMDLPGHGTVGGEWDLRGATDAYLGGVSFDGKRVLELGTASGFLCWHMESKGASVVGFDLSAERAWDLVPFARFDTSSHVATLRQHVERLKNGWWFARRLLNSRAKAVYGDIYALPKGIGAVDISTFGALLLHLRDPFQALFNAAQLTRETVIVTELHPQQPVGLPHSLLPKRGLHGIKQLVGHVRNRITSTVSSSRHPGALFFLPEYRSTDPNTAVTWWCFPPPVICQMLGVLGFERTTVTEHLQLFGGKSVRMYTVVAKRTLPVSQ